MDANEDWSSKSGTQLSNFIRNAGLSDPLCDRFYQDGVTRTTYARGSQQIDYILFDETLIPAIRAIGTLGLHEAMVSDHVMVYADLDEAMLFEGLVNRPVRVPNREFILAQADKKKIFLDAFKEKAKECRFSERARQLQAAFETHGKSPALVLQYNNLDREVQRRIIECASKHVKKKFGYNRSEALGKAGQLVSFWKSILSSRRRRCPPPPRCHEMAAQFEIEMPSVQVMPKREIRKQLRVAVESLRGIQYAASEHRQQGFEENARDIAKAAGELDWKKHMEKMLSEERQREVNRKLTSMVKGSHQGLTMVEVPIGGEWFYSQSNKEIYHYHRGVFECYAAWSPTPSLIPTHPWRFYSHHHLKVPHDDIVHAQVSLQGEFYILEAIFRPDQIWRNVTEPSEIEQLLLERNRRHLQQAVVEEGRTQNPLIQAMMGGHGTDLLNDIKNGTLDVSDATDEVIVAWIQVLQQTEAEAALPPITGEVSMGQYQEAFRRAKERTSSSACSG